MIFQATGPNDAIRKQILSEIDPDNARADLLDLLLCNDRSREDIRTLIGQLEAETMRFEAEAIVIREELENYAVCR